MDFYVLKKPQKNPNIDMQRKLSLLWRPELAHIQELNGMAKYKTSSKQFVIEKILAKVPQEQLQKQMSDELFERDYEKIADIINQFRVENNKKPRRRRKYRRVKRT
jgi:Na+/phosphate symporter